MQEAQLISKVGNMCIMILTSIMTDNIDRCKHYISDEIYDNLKQRIETNKNNNLREMFDEPNVATVSIVSSTIDNGKERIIVNVLLKYVHYYTDYQTYEYVKGDNYNREQHNIELVLEKNVDIQNIVTYTCPSCGSNMNITYTGICSYCGQPMDFEGKDYIIKEFNKK